MNADTAIQIFWFLLGLGIVLVCAEVFVPGGVLGFMGAGALFGAAVASFAAFPEYGLYISLAIVLLTGIALALWIKIFPKTRFGQRFILARVQKKTAASELARSALVGKEGLAQTDLHPGGIAKIDGRRTDVVTEGQMIAKGESVRVIKVEGFRVVVRKSGNKEDPTS